MVIWAQQNAVRVAGIPEIPLTPKYMVCFAPVGRPITARPGTAAVADVDGLADVQREGALGAPDGQHLPVAAQHRGQQLRIAQQTSDMVVRRRMTGVGGGFVGQLPQRIPLQCDGDMRWFAAVGGPGS